MTNGQNIKKAALAAGYPDKSASVIGSRLLRDDKVRREIARVEEQAITVSGYTIERHAQDIEEQRRLAIEDRQHTAAAKLLEMAGKLRGFYTEKVEITHKFEQMTDDELRSRIIAMQQDSGVWHHVLDHNEGGQ